LHKHTSHSSLQPDVARGVTRKLVARTTLLWGIVLSLASGLVLWPHRARMADGLLETCLAEMQCWVWLNLCTCL